MKIDPGKLGNWGRLYDELLSRALGVKTDANTQFQFLTTPQVASWSSQTNQYYADLWGNNAPFSLGPATSGPQIDVADAYYDFISSLVLPVPAAPAHQRLQTQLTALADQRTQTVSQALGAYNIWKQNAANFPDIKSIGDWLASPLTPGPSYSTTLAHLDTQIASIKAQLRPFEQGIHAAYTQAVKDADPENRVPVVIPGSADTKKIYDTRLTPDLSAFLATMAAGGTVNPVSVTLDRNDNYKGKWHVEGGASTEMSHFIGFAAQGTATRDTKIEDDSEFSVTLNVKGLQTFNIVRQNWMHSNMIAQHMKGPFAGTGQSSGQFFGDKGALKLVPTQVLVAYGATFSLNVSSSYYQKVKQQWETSAGLLIGPFFIGGKASGNSKTVTEKGQSTTVTIGSNNDTNAYVIGVSSMLFHEGDAKAAQPAPGKARAAAGIAG